MNPAPLTAIDLFAGCGGLSRGLMDAGIDVIAGVDAWAPAREIYEANLGHPAHNIDLSDTATIVNFLLANPASLIAGGPPCQDFSSAGKRQEGGRADLTRAYAEAIAQVKPTWFIMENVPQVQKSASYKTARDIYLHAGYRLTEFVFDASLCGAPQKRKRFIAIGRLGGRTNMVLPFIEAKLAKAPLTLRAYLGAEASNWGEAYYRHPRTYNRRGIFTIDEPSATIRGVNRPRPKNYSLHPGDFQSLNPASPAAEALTFEQRARIQTFPAGWNWCETSLPKSAIEQAIGNAVPVALGAFIGSCILEAEAAWQSQAMLAQWSEDLAEDASEQAA